MGRLRKTVSIYMTYKFIKILVTPWSKMDAYKFGIIDEEGNILKKYSSLKTQEEKDSYTLFDRLVWKLKRILGKIPGGRSRIASYASALWLIKENFPECGNSLERSFKDYLIENNFSSKEELNVIQESLQPDTIYMKDGIEYVIEGEIGECLGYKMYSMHKYQPMTPLDFYESVVYPNDGFILCEDAIPTNNASGGNIAGLGVGEKGEAGGKKRKSCAAGTFMNCIVFKVHPDKFYNSIRGKYPAHRYRKYVDEDVEGEEIRQYGRNNPGKGIILQNSITSEMIFLKRNKT